MSHTPPRHPCPRPACGGGSSVRRAAVFRPGPAAPPCAPVPVRGPSRHGAGRSPVRPPVAPTPGRRPTGRPRGAVPPAAGRGRPVRTPARTPLRAGRTGRCGAPLLAGHRTPGDVHRLAQLLAEVLVGRRAPEVLRDQLAVPVREELRRLRGAIPCGLTPRLSRVFHQVSRAGEEGAVVEASAVIGCERRARVFAFRARREGGRWVCTLLETDSAARSRTGVAAGPV